MGAQIYHANKNMTEVQGSVLLEGRSYIIDVSEFTEKEIKHWIRRERLERYLDHIVNNSFAQLKFINVVGNINLFGRIVDVRSTKLYDGYSGNEQFKKLVSELKEISSKLSYSYTGVSNNKREVDRLSFNPFDIQRFDYFYQLTFDFTIGNNLNSLINQILYNPNKKTVSNDEKVKVSNSKRLSKRFSQMIGKSRHFSELTKEHSLYNSPIVKNIRSRSGKSLLPTEILNVKMVESYDTTENRFIKFFLEEIKSICLRLSQFTKDYIIQQKVEELKNVIDTFLRQTFLGRIGRLYFMPDSSSVLLNKPGYREIYYHFIQSQFGFTSLVEQLSETSMKSGLKNIDTLYEIWTYFELGKRIFKNKKIYQKFNNKIIRNGDVIRNFSWSAAGIELRYNFSYNRRNKSSYSLDLRPDISLKVGNTLYLFDAKYKFSSTNAKNENEEILRIVKPEDIHKMHAYLDAIEEAVLSVALYPGNKFIFYNRKDKAAVEKIEDISLQGVGAIPLTPNSDATSLDKFINKVMTN